MNTNFKQIGAVAGGAFVGGAAMKLTKKSDGTSNPIGSIGSAALGIYLASKSKSPVLKNLGLGMAAVGVVGIVGNVAAKVPAISKYAPNINGLGELYEDENGNIIELGGINGASFVQDENGQTYMIEGLNGDDDMEDLVGFDDEDDYELNGIGELEDLV